MRMGGLCYFGSVQKLEVNVTGKLEVARAVRDSSDLAETCRSEGIAWMGKSHLVPGVQAIHFKHESPNILWQRKAPMHRGVKVLVPRVSQVEWLRAWRIANQEDISRGCRLRELRCVEIRDRRLAAPESYTKVAGGGAARATTVAAIDAGTCCAGHCVRHALPLQREDGCRAVIEDDGSWCSRSVRVDT